MMKRELWLHATALLCVLVGQAYCGDPNESFVVDHTAVQEFDKIPAYWLDKAKELTFHYGCTSHGSQLLAGMLYIEEYIDPKYSVAMLTYQESPVLPPVEDPSAFRVTQQGAQPQHYWDSEEGVANTMTFAESGLYGYSMWSWSGQVHYIPTDYIQLYLDTMDMFEELYPDMRFIYMTGHAENVDPEQIVNTGLIREHCRTNNKILYDFEDIEMHDLDGVFHPETNDMCQLLKRTN